MIPRYDLLDYLMRNVIAYSNEIMSNEQIDKCNELIQENNLVFNITEEDDLFSVRSLEDVCW